MARLDCSIHPLLTENSIDRLFKRKVFTVLSFVQTDPEVIAKVSGLQYGNVLVIRSDILTKFSSPLTTGYKLYNEVIEQCAIIRTGIINLDNLLDGGFVTGNIYELCGETGSGKTQLCMTVAVNVTATYPDQTVIYVDTKNDLSPSRILQIMNEKPLESDRVSSAMNRIKICRINQAKQLLSFLHDLIQELHSTDDKSHRIRLVIVDSISSIFFGYVGNEANRGFVLLNHLSDLLHYVAVEYHVVVLITNLVTNWSTSEPECDSDEFGANPQEVQSPVLGKFWSHVPETRINIKKLENSENRLLVVMKSGNEPVGKTTQVVITDAGVV